MVFYALRPISIDALFCFSPIILEMESLKRSASDIWTEKKLTEWTVNADLQFAAWKWSSSANNESRASFSPDRRSHENVFVVNSLMRIFCLFSTEMGNSDPKWELTPELTIIWSGVGSSFFETLLELQWHMAGVAHLWLSIDFWNCVALFFFIHSPIKNGKKSP